MGRSLCYDKAGLKKGPWTPEEDEKLLAYIQEHGHQSWRTLPSKAGLERCGKSCRLRWTNYLRPDIKRGKFSLQEEQTIIQLHALLGNRWSAIANHLPKRTDNEIKNYWNTHLKKKLTKMGIDPITHKPKNHALGCSGQSKDFTNLCHTAQWESARLEAEARLVRESKSVLSDPYHFLAAAAAAVEAPQPLPPRPPCLDILQVWVQTNPEVDILNFRFQTVPELHARSQTSTSNFEMSKTYSADLPKLNCHQEEVRGIMEDTIELHDMMNPVDSTHAGFPSFMEGFVDVPPSIVSVEACWNVVEDNYWGNYP